jgi:fucose permease
MAKHSSFLVLVLFVIFFVISLLTNIIGPLVPDIIQSFQLNLTLAAFLPFSFFAAYAVMSIPAGMVIESLGEKTVLLAAFGLALAGSLLFACFPFYRTAILSLFLIGLGMAALQVAINPLLRVAGGEEHFAFNSIIVQFVFGLASFLSPLVYSYFAIGLKNGSASLPVAVMARIVPADRPWISMYWVFAVITVAMIALIAALHLPRVDRKEDERVGAWEVHRELFAKPTVWLYFAAIFAYVGLEQGLSNWMSQFLSVAHGLDPQREGAMAVSRFWGVMTIGALLGMVLLKFFDSRKVLIAFSALAFFTFSAALFGSAAVAVWAFPATGFAISLMWGILFSLALNSLASHHGTFSGILCTGIVGGALVPLLIGSIGDHFSLRAGLCVLYLPLLYIFSVGIWARPLVANKTIG